MGVWECPSYAPSVSLRLAGSFGGQAGVGNASGVMNFGLMGFRKRF
jgi:hypothetical protein